MDLEENVKINLCEFEGMNLCVFLINLKDKVIKFKNKFCETYWVIWSMQQIKKIVKIDRIWSLPNYPWR